MELRLRRMLAEDLLEVIGARSRARLSVRLIRRPHSLAEMAHFAGISNQATLKHLKFLQEKGLVRTIPLEGGTTGIRILYQLAQPMLIELAADEDVTQVLAFASETSPTLSTAVARLRVRPSFAEVLELEDEAGSLQRQIRMARKRLVRLFRLLADVRRAQDQLLGRIGMGPIAAALTYSYLERGDETALRETARKLGADDQTVRQVLRVVHTDTAG